MNWTTWPSLKRCHRQYHRKQLENAADLSFYEKVPTEWVLTKVDEEEDHQVDALEHHLIETQVKHRELIVVLDCQTAEVRFDSKHSGR